MRARRVHLDVREVDPVAEVSNIRGGELGPLLQVARGQIREDEVLPGGADLLAGPMTLETREDSHFEARS